MSTVIDAMQDELTGSHVVHLTFAMISLTMALFSLYLDLRFFYGWSQGAWLFKLTHWSLAVTLLFLTVSVADALTFGWVLAGPRRWLMYTALVLAMTVDANYFMVLVPQRLLRMNGARLKKPKSGLTPVSTHKHLLNLTWILGDAGTYVVPHNPRLRHKPLELLVCGVLVPMGIFAAYLTLAYAIKSRKRGPGVLRAFGVPVADRDDAKRISIRRRSAHRREKELHETAQRAAAMAAQADAAAGLPRRKQSDAASAATPSALTVASLAVANSAGDAARRASALPSAEKRSSVQRASVKRSSVKRRSVNRNGASDDGSGSWDFDEDVDFEDDYEDDMSSASSFSTLQQDDLTRRVKPGRWIYSSFQYRKLRSAFLLQSLVYGPVAWTSLEMAEGLLVGQPALQLAALVLVSVITPVLYGPELWERSKATLFMALVQVRKDFASLRAYLGRVISAFIERHRVFFHELQLQMEERARLRRERIKRLIPKVRAAVGNVVDAALFVTKEVAKYLWQNAADVAAGVRDFVVGSVPAALRYTRKIVRALVRMVWRDVVDGIAEVHEWIDSVELEEYE